VFVSVSFCFVLQKIDIYLFSSLLMDSVGKREKGRASSSSKKDLPTYKVMVIGSTATGKTCIIRRIIEGFFTRVYKVSIGVEFNEKDITFDRSAIGLIVETDKRDEERDRQMDGDEEADDGDDGRSETSSLRTTSVNSSTLQSPGATSYTTETGSSAASDVMEEVTPMTPQTPCTPPHTSYTPLRKRSFLSTPVGKMTDPVTVRLNLWDLAGQDRFVKFSRPFFRKAFGAVIVYDTNRYQTFKDVTKWVHGLRAAVPEVSSADGSTHPIPCILLANKIDVGGISPSPREIRHLAEEEKIDAWFPVSALTGEGLEEAFTFLAWTIDRLDPRLDVVLNRRDLEERKVPKKKKGCCSI
jgi:GTPase SAR1 family protein